MATNHPYPFVISWEKGEKEMKGKKNDAPDWTRTSMPVKAQALNLPCIPIPPQGLFTLKHRNYTNLKMGLSSRIN